MSKQTPSLTLKRWNSSGGAYTNHLALGPPGKVLKIPYSPGFVLANNPAKDVLWSAVHTCWRFFVAADANTEGR